MTTTLEKTNGTAQPSTRTPQYRRPRYTVVENKDAYELRVEMPGVPRDHAEVNVEADHLVVTGRPPAPERPEGSRVLHRELSTVPYRLPLRLNVDIDAERAEARTENGILVVNLPIAEASKPRTIPVE